MSRSHLHRKINRGALVRACALAMAIAMEFLAGVAPVAALEQGAPNVDQLRMRAPIGARQPRPSDLPPRVLQDEKNVPASPNRYDFGVLNICRGC